jgi:hypothetical protein
MSKQNKANRNNYMQAGRLTPDDMARERMKQHKPGVGSAPRERVTNRTSEPRGRGEQASSPRRSEREESA